MSSITVAEIHYGIERLPDGRRKEELREAADDVLATFAGDVLAFDARAAAEYAGIAYCRDRSGTPIDGFDAQIASICRMHHARPATRNVKDFEKTSVDVVNPWIG